MRAVRVDRRVEIEPPFSTCCSAAVVATILVIVISRNRVSDVSGSSSPTARGPAAVVDHALAVGDDGGDMRDAAGVDGVLQDRVESRGVEAAPITGVGRGGHGASRSCRVCNEVDQKEQSWVSATGAELLRLR
jgi:hypothetical protein